MSELNCYFKKIHNQLEASFNKALRNYGLTSTQFDFLAYLSQNGRCQNTLTDISAHFGVKHTSAIHVLKILEEKGLIEKTRSSDGRSKRITLTGRGCQIIAEIINKKPLVDEIIFAGLSADDLALLEKMLKQIYTNLESDVFRKL